MKGRRLLLHSLQIIPQRAFTFGRRIDRANRQPQAPALNCREQGGILSTNGDKKTPVFFSRVEEFFDARIEKEMRRKSRQSN